MILRNLFAIGLIFLTNNFAAPYASAQQFDLSDQSTLDHLVRTMNRRINTIAKDVDLPKNSIQPIKTALLSDFDGYIELRQKRGVTQDLDSFRADFLIWVNEQTSVHLNDAQRSTWRKLNEERIDRAKLTRWKKQHDLDYFLTFLDLHLQLTPKQRTEISKELAKKWFDRPQTDRVYIYLINGPTMANSLIDGSMNRKVVAYLDDHQKERLKTFPGLLFGTDSIQFRGAANFPVLLRSQFDEIIQVFQGRLQDQFELTDNHRKILTITAKQVAKSLTDERMKLVAEYTPGVYPEELMEKMAWPMQTLCLKHPDWVKAMHKILSNQQFEIVMAETDRRIKSAKMPLTHYATSVILQEAQLDFEFDQHTDIALFFLSKVEIRHEGDYQGVFDAIYAIEEEAFFESLGRDEKTIQLWNHMDRVRKERASKDDN